MVRYVTEIEVDDFVAYRNQPAGLGTYTKLSQKEVVVARKYVDNGGWNQVGNDEFIDKTVFTKRPQIVEDFLNNTVVQQPDKIAWEDQDYLVPLKYKQQLFLDFSSSGLVPEVLTRIYFAVDVDTTTVLASDDKYWEFNMDFSKVLKGITTLIVARKFQTPYSIRVFAQVSGLLLPYVPNIRASVGFSLKCIHSNDPVSPYDGLFYSTFIRIYQERVTLENHFLPPDEEYGPESIPSPERRLLSIAATCDASTETDPRAGRLSSYKKRIAACLRRKN